MAVIAPVKHERAALPDETQRPTSPTIDLGLDLRRLLAHPQLGAGKKYHRSSRFLRLRESRLHNRPLVQGGELTCKAERHAQHDETG